MVAEKPSLAQSISKILSNNQMQSRKGFNNACSIHEWNGKFLDLGNVKYRMTSVCGHVMSLDFLPKYNSWDKVDPAELFKAETLKKEATANLKMPAFLEKEARGCDFLVLWLDCDKEGENICFEVIDCVKHAMNRPLDGYRKDQYLRAHFSSITDTDIKRAMNNLGYPNKNESLSVDARQELDLRIGCAFTRFQTRFFQGKYGDLDSSLVSYGPCQTPTLSFCVERMDKIKQFKPETYWYLDLVLLHQGVKFYTKWSRVRLFDKEVCYMFLNDLKNETHAKVINVKQVEKVKARPNALNTVEMLRAASAGLGMSPMHAMHIAEKLYTQGYISYPRTETTQYASNFDLKSVLLQQKNNSSWSDNVKKLLDEGFSAPRKGTDVGDHPPITPTASATHEELGGDAWKLYEFICRHFIATISHDCKYEEVTVTFLVKQELFTYTGKSVSRKGWTELMPWKAIDSKEQIPSIKQNDMIEISTLKISESQTNPPDYLTESELISLMEKNGIGTDASIPVHINNICERNYVKLERDRRLAPTTLGIVLVHGYQAIDPDLCLPKMRSQVEAQLNLIAIGKANYNAVLQHTLKIFEQKFHYFVQNIIHMDSLFEDSFSPLSAMGKPMSRCGKCRRFMKLVSSKPQRLYCENCKDTYNLPQNGSIKLYRELKCPLDEFELLLVSLRNRNYSFCPYCYNNPPFQDMKKGSSCIECSHPTCQYSFITNGISQCFDCQNGILLLDTTTPPKYRIFCNKCPLSLSLPDTIFKMEISEDSCESCETTLLDINYNKNKTPLENGETETQACLYCDPMFKQIIDKYFESTNKKFNNGHFKRGFRPGGKRRVGGGGRKKRRTNGKSLNW